MPAAVSEHMSASAVQSEFPDRKQRRSPDHLPHSQRSLRRRWNQQLLTMPVPHEVREIPVGPAVVPEPWTPAPRIPDARPPSRRLPTYDPLHLDHPCQPLPARFPRCRDSLTHRRTRQPVPPPRAGPSRSAPRFLGRAPGRPSPSHHQPIAMSFSSHVRLAQSSETGSPAEDGFTSVQLQPASESGSISSGTRCRRAASAAPATPSSGPPPPAAGTKPTELDELARRLYEPSPHGCGRSCGWTVNEQE